MRHVIAAVITTFALCTPAAGTMGDYPWPIFGAMLGGAVDCLVTRCTAQVPKGVWPGMFAGMAITAFAPRRVAGTFLGVGGSIVAGSLIGGAIEGDYRADHPCTKGVLIGDTVGLRSQLNTRAG